MRISDWSSDVCASDLESGEGEAAGVHQLVHADHVVGDRPEDDGRQHGRGDEALVERAHDVLRGAELHEEGADDGGEDAGAAEGRSEEHTSELQSLMRISYAVFCLKKKKKERA